MTRFARAKGSKASNEKVPEDSTPWEVMKEQLLQAKKENEEAKGRQEAEKQRIENYENFLKEHKTKKRKATWCEFPESEKGDAAKNFQLEGQVVQKKKKNKQLLEVNDEACSKNPPVVNNDCNPENKSKKKKNKHDKDSESIKGKKYGFRDNDGTSQEPNDGSNQDKPKKTKMKNFNEALVLEESKPMDDNNVVSSGQHSKEKHKKKNQNSNSTSSHQTESNVLSNGTEETVTGNVVDKKNKKKNKNKGLKNPTDLGQTNETKNNSNQIDKNKSVANKQNKVKALKNKKFKDGVPTRRKEINDHSFQLIINGKEVELVRFDGFPIMKRDAERIQELKNSMIKKGIPKSEVQRTIKLERRRAEKALARLKKDVCYNCRKGGHNLSDCPDLKSKIPGVDAAEGVCFKCGSTEHRQFECKVQRDKEFRFATCFICKEPGHIARQCPDNPKGLYPNGGACKLCGDVTHLRKDCPTVNDKKEETTVKLQTLATSDNIEEMNVPVKGSTHVPADSSKKPKKIKF